MNQSKTILQRKLLSDHIAQCVRSGCPNDQIENFINKGVILLPKQMQASAAARECDKEGGPTHVAYAGSRGGAKSFWMLSQVALDDCQRCPTLQCLLLRKVGKANREQFEAMRMKILQLCKHDYLPSYGRVRFPNGSLIIAGHFQKPSDIDAYVGLEYDVIAVEEATTLSEGKLKDIESCLRTSKPNWRPRMYLTANPGGLSHQFFKKTYVDPWVQGKQTYTRFIPSHITDNPFLNAGYIKTLEKYSGWQRKAWLDGDWNIAAGQFFSNFSEKSHVIDDDEGNEWIAPWDDARAKSWSGSLDYGFKHYTVFQLHAEDGEGNLVTVDEHCMRSAPVEIHAMEIRDLLERHGLTLNNLDFIVAGHDVFSRESDGSTVANHYEDEGIVLEKGYIDRVNGCAAMIKRLGNPDDPEVHKRIRPTWFIHRNCKYLIEQLPTMQHNPNKPETYLKNDLQDEEGELSGGDDSVDAARIRLASEPSRPVTWAKAFGGEVWHSPR